MKLIINDKRYAALKSLGEKKQCFNEYLQQRKKGEKEEERQRLKRAKEACPQPCSSSNLLDMFMSDIFYLHHAPCKIAAKKRELFHKGNYRVESGLCSDHDRLTMSMTVVLCVTQEFEGMLEESKDIKLGFRYGQVRTLFEDDPRWKVMSLLCTAKPFSPQVIPSDCLLLHH